MLISAPCLRANLTEFERLEMSSFIFECFFGIHDFLLDKIARFTYTPFDSVMKEKTGSSRNRDDSATGGGTMKHFLRFLDNFEEHLAGWTLLVMALLYFMEVVLRYVFSHSNAWVEELLRYMMVLITFFGASVAIKYGAHMSVNVIGYFPAPRLKQVIAVFVALMGVLFSAFTLYFSWLLMVRIKGFGQHTPAMQIPMYIPYAILPFGFLSMLIRFTLQLIRAFNLLGRKESGKA